MLSLLGILIGIGVIIFIAGAVLFALLFYGVLLYRLYQFIKFFGKHFLGNCLNLIKKSLNRRGLLNSP